MKSEKGMVSLEACVTVLFFMTIMFLLTGLFLMYMAQNTTAHVLLQTSQSLALDNYAAEKVGDVDIEAVHEAAKKGAEAAEQGAEAAKQGSYLESAGWYLESAWSYQEAVGTLGEDIGSIKDLMVLALGDTLNIVPDLSDQYAFASNRKLKDIKNKDKADSKEMAEIEEMNADVAEAAKNRFIAYLTNGDKGKYASLTEKADSMLKSLKVENGLDGLDFSESTLNNGKLTIVVTYQLNYIFRIAELGKIDVRQETSSKLWK